MTTTHDAYRSTEETLFSNFQRHPSIRSPATASLASFRSMTASDLIGLLPGTPQSTTQRHHPQRQQQQQQQQQRSRLSRDRPASDFIHSQFLNGTPSSTQSHLTESEEIDQWFENIQRYEQMLEEVAAASLDETFKDELHHVNQWIRCRSDAERTAALYSVVQNASQIQIRFLIMVLQQLVNQDPFGNLLTAGQDKDSLIASVAGSVVSTESEYERRKRHLYTSVNRRGRHNEVNTNTNNSRTPIRITSASSEPDDLRRNRDLFGSARSLVESSTINSVLGRQGLLHEKALAARAQILAANGGGRAAATLAATKLNSPGGRLQQQQQQQQLHLSNTLSTPTRTPSPLESNISTDTPTPKHPSLFGTDWPFPATRHSERSSLVGRIGDHRSTSSKSSVDDGWSFNSALSKRKKDLMELPSWNGRKSGSIREERESAQDLPIRHLNNKSPPSPSKPSRSSLTTVSKTGTTGGNMLNSSLNNSLNALELAQARLRGESIRACPLPRSTLQSTSSNGNPINMKPDPTRMDTLLSTSPSAKPPSPTTTTTLDIPTMSPRMVIPSSTTSSSLGHFLTPPTVYENQVLETSLSSTTTTSNVDYQSDHSEGSTGSTKENVLTGTARRRKRSSAARALKDKIAAETVDLELMKDVQNWLRSLRLHKYGHAFTGLQWQQVIRMDDKAMIDAGVNTIGARRKLLKVFENVQRHCEDNDIDY